MVRGRSISQGLRLRYEFMGIERPSNEQMNSSKKFQAGVDETYPGSAKNQYQLRRGNNHKCQAIIDGLTVILPSVAFAFAPSASSQSVLRVA